MDFLIRDKFLTKADVKDADFGSDPEFIDYAKVYEARRPILEKAVKAILAEKKEAKKFEAFKSENANWLADYADFMAIKEHFNNKALQDWDDKKAVKRDEATLEKLRKELADVITYHQVVQYLFFSQWAELKAYANKNGIQIIGDMPIYISADSVEVWTQPHLFKLDAECKPRYIAGVPPDNFSATGQLWGNPIYAWDKHKAENYAWWVFRIQESFKLYDYLRIDHFKGFLTSGKFLEEMKLLKMVNGFLDLVMTFSKWLKKNWVILKSLPKTLVTLMIRHVNFLQTVVTLE